MLLRLDLRQSLLTSTQFPDLLRLDLRPLSVIFELPCVLRFLNGNDLGPLRQLAQGLDVGPGERRLLPLPLEQLPVPVPPGDDVKRHQPPNRLPIPHRARASIANRASAPRYHGSRG